MSVTAAAEPAGFQSRHVRRMPNSAWAYGATVFVLAVAAAFVTARGVESPSRSELLAFLLLLPLAVAAPLLRVSTGRNQSLSTTSAFVVAGALVLPPELLVALVVLLHLPEWLVTRLPWYIQTFNIGNYTLDALAAWAVIRIVGGEGDLAVALAGLGAAGTFVVVNHVLLAPMLKLGRGHSFRESGLFSPLNLAIESVVAALGIAVALFVQTNPWLLPTLLAPMLLARRSTSMIALLRQSEERFRAMFEGAPVGTMILGLDSRLVAANRAIEELLGYDEAQLRAMSESPMHPDDRAEGAELGMELVRGERDAYQRAVRYIRADGEIVYTHLAMALVRDADAKPAFAIAMVVDVTGQTELEERLRQSQKLEAIGRLAGGVAHDFNNMLTAIGGYNALALERLEPDSPIRSDLQEIGRATDRATALTRQLLAFSRKQVLQPELLNLNGVVVEMEAMLRPLIGENVVLETDFEPALGPIEADPGQLQQVVLNLVVNARDAMAEGGRIVVETANVDVGEDDPSIEPGRYVSLTVRDTGHGIDEETLTQIFEPFFTTKERGKGTGLGLATVYGIVKQSGGYVVVESEPGAGTAFTIYLRRVAEARPSPREANAVPVAAVARGRSDEDRDRAARRGRGGRPPARPPGAGGSGLRRPRGCRRGRGRASGDGAPRRPAPDRPDDAEARRARGRGAPPRAQPRPPGRADVGLRGRGQRRRAARPANSTAREAVYVHRADGHRARPARDALAPSAAHVVSVAAMLRFCCT